MYLMTKCFKDTGWHKSYMVTGDDSSERCYCTLTPNFIKCRQIHKLLSPSVLAVNLQQSRHQRSHTQRSLHYVHCEIL